MDDFRVQTEIEIAKEQAKVKAWEERIKFEKYFGEDEVISSYKVQEYYKQMAVPSRLYNTGMPVLDSIVEGFEDGDIVIVSGITGNGKTLFCRTLTKQFSRIDVECLWFSYEESPMSLIAKFVDVCPMFYLPKKLVSSNLAWIEDRIIESRVKYGTRVVFIDHLHFLVPLSGTQNMSMLIGGIVRELKTMAIRNSVAIFLICHMTKVSPTDVLDVHHLRDSSMIAAEADKVIIVKRLGEIHDGELLYSNESKVYIRKNRRTGNLGSVKMRFNNGLLEELEYI